MRYKDVEFWEPDNPEKDQFLVMSRKFGCYVSEKVEQVEELSEEGKA